MIILVVVVSCFSAPPFDPTTFAHFTARMKLTRSRCAHGVLRRKRKEAAVTCSPTAPARKHSNGKGSGGSPRDFGGVGARARNVHQFKCASKVHQNAPWEAGAIGQWHPNLYHEVEMVAGRQSGADAGSLPTPHETTLVAWDEPWPHLSPSGPLYFSHRPSASSD